MTHMEREGPDGLLTVGLVARRSGLTAKARRHYDRVGLLRPTVVDRTTGYRLYRSEQIAEAWLGVSCRSWPSRAAAGGMARKAEEERIAELFATTATPRDARPADAQQTQDRQDMP